MPRTEDILFTDIGRQVENDPGGGYAKAAKLMKQRFSQAQKEVDADPATCKAVLASRRTGKSYWAGTTLVGACLEIPFANCLYVTLTKGSGRSIIWSFLKHLDREFGLGVSFHNTNLVITFKNGSVLQLVGAENRSEIDKIRGQGYDYVIIDECKSFPTSVLKELIEEVIFPALMDRMGKLAMIGTPGAILEGPFYDITEMTNSPTTPTARAYVDRDEWPEGKPFVWSVHRWTLDDAALPHVKQQAHAIKVANGWGDDHPAWSREYLGLWVPSANAIVYHYNWDGSQLNDFEPDPESDNMFGLPKGHEWIYLMGLDFGFNDDFALVVGAYSPTHPNFYQVHSYKSPHLTVDEIAKVTLQTIEMIGDYEVAVGDAGGLGKTIIASLAAQYGISIIPAEKKEKLDYIELLNTDLLCGRCLVDPDGDVAEEWRVLQFDASGLKEHPGCANHASDAFLYLWRYAYHRFHHELVQGPKRGSREWWIEREKQAAEEAAREVLSQQGIEHWEQYKLDGDENDFLPDGDNLWLKDLIKKIQTTTSKG